MNSRRVMRTRIWSSPFCVLNESDNQRYRLAFFATIYWRARSDAALLELPLTFALPGHRPF
jgi:hypothetical protein